MKRNLCLAFVLVFLSLACSLGGADNRGDSHQPQIETQQNESTVTSKAESLAVPSIYLTVALHIEDTPVYARCDAYPDFRQKLLDFAAAMESYPAAINLQVEYEFLMGVSRCETPEMQTNTQGQNVLAYLASQHGYEIDPHQEGGWDIEGRDNYADIRFLGGQVTSAISENVGGLVWDDPGQWAALANGERGQLWPDFVWTPEVLTLAVSSDHHRGDFSDDDHASGVWRPAGAGENFWVHDPDGPIIYIGPGEHANWGERQDLRSTLEFIQALLAQLETGKIEPDRMYTATLAVPQSIIFHPEEHANLQALLSELAPLVEAGKVVYVTYSQAAEIWRTQYDSQPNIFYLK